MNTRSTLDSLEWHVFSNSDVSALFVPETLQVFLLNRPAARVLSSIRSGLSINDAALANNISPDAIYKLMASTGEAIAKAPLAYGEPHPIDPAKSKETTLPKLVLMVNNFCNLKCSYCYEHNTVFNKPGLSMTEQIARTTLDKFNEAFNGIHTLMFIGGEPTLNSDVIAFACDYANQIAERKTQPPPRFCMISNGLKIDDRMFSLIEQHQIQTTFSIDGPKPVNDLVRIRHDGSGSYDDVKKNIERYQAAVPDGAGLECTLTAMHEMSHTTVKDLVTFAAKDMGILHPHIAAAGLPNGHHLDPFKDGGERLSREFQEAAEHSVKSLLDGMVTQGKYTPAEGSLDTVTSIFETILRHEGKLNMCPAGVAQLVVDAYGDLYPCWMFAGVPEFQMGNVLRDDVFNALALKVLRRIAKNTKRSNPQCAKCYARYACSACIGNNHNGTGAIETMNEGFCNTVRETVKTVVLGLGKAKQNPDQWNALSSAAASHNRGREDFKGC